jgi:uncharacterized membrane protein
MRIRVIRWIWNKGVVGTFLSGIFALLPIIVTVGVIVWLAGYVTALLGPGSLVGRGLKYIGLQFVTSEVAGYIIGCALTIVAIWAFGWLVKSKAKLLFRSLLEWPKHLPVVGSIYGTAQQVVQMVNRDDDDTMKGMEVVYAGWKSIKSVSEFSLTGGGFLALSPQGTYNFDGQECRIVYIPTSPVPMSGGCIFWPVEQVKVAEGMTPDQLMQIYLSLGVLASQAVPEQYRCQVGALSAGNDDV